jgi:NAD(P)H dehydrogenase (quinone)
MDTLTPSSQYSMYGHIKQLADAELEGIKKAGGSADVYQ